MTASTKLLAKQEKDGITAIRDFMRLVDDLGNTCYYGVETYVVLDYSTFVTGGAVLENVLYNAGFMFTDVLEIVLNNENTITQWSYFIAFRVGDFLIRFFYKDSTTI